MSSYNDIQFSVGFKTDDSSLKKLRESLQQIQNMTRGEFLKINPEYKSEGTKKILHDMGKIKNEASLVEHALAMAYNPKLGTYNIEKFNKIMGTTKNGLSELQQSWSKMGAAGKNAFLDLEHSLLKSHKSLEKTQTIIDKIGITLGNTIKWNIASAAINQVSRSVSEAYGYVKNLDTSLNNIRIVTGKSADEMAVFADKANDAAKGLGIATTSYTNSALTFYQQGLSDQEVEARTNLTSKVSNASGLSAEESAEYVTSVLNGYKVGSEEAEKAMDVLANVGAHTASSLSELSQAMAKTASTANTMGVSEEQLAATLATVIETTRQDPKSVGTAFKTIYMRISDIQTGAEDAEVSLGHYTKQMKDLGINVLDSSGQLRDLGEVMEEVGSGWADMSREQQISLARVMAGTRQANNLLALFDNWDTYGKALGYATDSVGTLQNQQNIYMESTRAHLQTLKAQWEDLYDSLLDTDSINIVADIIGVLVNEITKFVDAIGGGKSVLLAFGAIASRVFNEQIALGISNAVSRLRNFNIEKQQNKELAANARNEKGKYEKGTPEYERNNMREQYYNNAHLLNEEQKEHLVSLQDELVVLEKRNNLLQEALEIQKNEGKVNFSEKFGSDKISFKDKGKVIVADIYNGLLEGSTAHKEAKIDTKQRSLYNDKYINSIIGDGTKENKGAIDSIKKANSRIQEKSASDFYSNRNFKNSIPQSMFGKLEVMQPYIKSLTEAQNALSKTKKGTQEYEEALARTHKELNIFKGKCNEITESIEQMGMSMNDYRNAVTEDASAINQKMEGIKNTAKNMRQEFNKTIEETQRTQNIQSFINVLGGISSVGMSLSSLSQIPEIISNDDLTTFQKFQELLTSGSMGVMMLMMGITQLTTGVKELKNAQILANAVAKIRNLLYKTEKREITTLDIAYALAAKRKAEIAGASAAEAEMAYNNVLAQRLETASTLNLSGAIKKLGNSFASLYLKMLPIVVIGTAIGMLAKGIYDVATATSKAEKNMAEFNQSFSEFNKNQKEKNEKVNNLKNSIAEFDALSAKAGKNDSNLSSLSDEELARYNELKEAIIDADETMLAYYDNQGNAILKGNDDLQTRIDLIEKKNRLEKEEAWKEFSEDYEKDKNTLRGKAERDIKEQSSRIEGHLAPRDEVSRLLDWFDGSDKMGLLSDSKVWEKIQEEEFWNGNVEDLIKSVGTDEYNEFINTLRDNAKNLGGAKAVNEFIDYLEEQNEEALENATKFEENNKLGADYLYGKLTSEREYFDTIEKAANGNGILAENAINIASTLVNDSYSLEDYTESQIADEAEKVTKKLLKLANGNENYFSELASYAQSIEPDEIDSESLQIFIDKLKKAGLSDDELISILNYYFDLDNINVVQGKVQEGVQSAYNNAITNAAKSINLGDNKAVIKKIREGAEKSGGVIDEKLFSSIYSVNVATSKDEKSVEEKAAENAAKNAAALNNISKSTSITDFHKNWEIIDKDNYAVKNSLDDVNDSILNTARGFENCSEEVKNFEVLTEGLINVWDDATIDKVVSDFEIAVRAGEIAASGVTESSADEIEILGKAYKYQHDINKELDGIEDKTEGLQQNWADVAAQAERFREALDVKDDLKSIQSTLKNFDITSLSGKQLKTMSEAYADILNVSEDAVESNDSFLFDKDTLDAALDVLETGSEEAVSIFREKWTDSLTEGLDNSADFWDSITDKAEEAGIDVGDSFMSNFKKVFNGEHWDQEMAQKMVDQLTRAGKTGTEIESIFADAGYNVTVDQMGMARTIQTLAEQTLIMIQGFIVNLGAAVGAFLNAEGPLSDRINVAAEKFAADTENTSTKAYSIKYEKGGTKVNGSYAQQLVEMQNAGLGDQKITIGNGTQQLHTVNEWNTIFKKKGLITDDLKPGGSIVNFDGYSGYGTGFSDIVGGSNAGKDGSSKKSGSSNKKNKTQKTELDEERDIYYEIEESLNKIEHDYSLINKQRKHLEGKALADSIAKENKYIEKNISLLQDRIKISQQALADTQSELSSTYGAQFDADGLFTNYTDVWNKEYEKYQAAAKAYDAAKNDDNEDNDEAADEAWKNAEKRFKDFEELAGKQNEYIDKIYSDTEEILDKQYEIISNNIEAVTAEIEVTLDLNKAKEEWIDFQSNYLKGEDQDSNLVKINLDIEKINVLDDSKVIDEAKKNLDIFNFAYEQAAAGNISALLQNETTKGFVGKGINGEDIVDLPALRKAMEEAQSTYIDAYSEREDLIRDIYASERDQIDKVYDAVQKVNDLYKKRGELLDHNIKMVQLTKGEDAYADIAKIQQDKNALTQINIDRLRGQADNQRSLMNEALAQMNEHAADQDRTLYNHYKEEYEKYAEELESTTDEIESSLENLAESLKDTFENSVNATLQSFSQAITGFANPDQLEFNNTLETLNRDTYLDDVEKGFELKALRNKWIESINDTDSVTAQRKLNDLMDDQLKKLEEKGELTEKDLERANLEYELALKQIALEEAQQNKSKMRLKRDSQGNYSYQFVSDDDALAEAQAAVDEAQYNLYKFDKETARDNADEILNVWSEMFSALQEHASEGEEVLEKIAETYTKRLLDLAGENDYLIQNLLDSGTQSMLDMFGTVADGADIIMGAGLENTIKGIVDKISNDPDSFKNSVNGTVDEIEDNYNELQNKLEELGDTHSSVADDIVSDIDTMTAASEQFLRVLEDEFSMIKEIGDKYESAKAAEIAEKNRQAQAQAQANAANGSGSNSGTNGGLDGSGIGSGTPNNGKAEIGDTVTLKDGALYHEDSWGRGRTGSKYAGVSNGVIIDKVNGNEYGVHIKSADGKYEDLGWVKLEDILGYASGGYTGQWSGGDGKLAFLHQKELVLNENDTKNLLSTIDVMKTIYDGYRNKVSDLISSMRVEDVISTFTNTMEDIFDELELNQNVEISATFEGQTEADQIKQAFENLVNTASQRAFRRNR